MKRKLIVITIIILFLLSVIWVVWGNISIGLTAYTAESGNLPVNFDGFRIAQVSDLHNGKFGKDNEKLLDLLKECKPDIIAITGDLIDSRRTDTEVALQFVKNALEIAPCYYVTGNHEERLAVRDDFLESLQKLGVNVLDDKESKIKIEGESIKIIGVKDPLAETDYLFGDSASVISNKIKALKSKGNEYTILLSHRPELFEIYYGEGIDLVLSGHAHGGQIRLPFVGGVFAPHQGFLPKYDAGTFTKDRTTMIVSRGIGQSIIPLRFCNRPELVIIELKIKQSSVVKEVQLEI